MNTEDVSRKKREYYRITMSGWDVLLYILAEGTEAFMSKKCLPVTFGKEAAKAMGKPISDCEYDPEGIMRLAGHVIVELGRSGQSLSKQRRALRLALAWLNKGPSAIRDTRELKTL